MVKKETTIDKKTMDKIKGEVLQNITDEIKNDLSKEVIEEVRKELNGEYKKELKEHIVTEVISDVKLRVQKDQDRVIRRKSFKIFRLSVYVLILLVLSVYLIYRLYNAGDIKRVEDLLPNHITKTTSVSNITTTTNTSDKTTEITVATTTTTTTTTTKNLELLIKEYGSLLNIVNINKVDFVNKETKVSDLKNEDISAMALLNISSKVKGENSIYQISGEDLKKSVIEVFGDSSLYNTDSFTALGLDFKYSSSIDTFFAIGELDKNVFIANKIFDIDVNEKRVKIICYTAYINDNKVYNTNNLNDSLGVFDNNLSDYTSKLGKVTYTFENGYLTQIN